MNIPLLAMVLREMLDREEEKLYKQGPWQSCQKRKTKQNKTREKHMVMKESLSVGMQTKPSWMQ